MAMTSHRLLSRRDYLTQACVMCASAMGASSVMSQTQKEELPTVGSRLVLPEITLLNGEVLKPEQTQGKLVVIYWWASWCPFCALQSPEIQKLHAQYQSKGLFVLGLSIDKEAQLAKSYLQKKNYTFASTWASPQVLQKIKKPNGLPVTLVYGRDSKLLQAEKGQMFAEDISAISSWL
jgi:thiol-disulfide isomerase/thioredoxin